MPAIFADGTASILENPSDNFIMLVFVAGCVLFVLILAGGAVWHHIRKTDADHSLKVEMIQQGMSAEEIERVLAAKSGSAKKSCSGWFTK